MGGTYTLVIEFTHRRTIRFGALGERRLDPGWYAYVGSALGPGGFARVDRHRAVAAGENDTRHWHIDYLLGHPSSRLVDTIRLPATAAECAIGRAIEAAPISGVGASDCDCPTHLFFRNDRNSMAASIEAAHAAHS